MKQILYPSEYLPSAYQIDYGGLYHKGCRGLIFDIDNTLVPHGAPADDRAIALFARLKELGLDSVLGEETQEAEREAHEAGAEVHAAGGEAHEAGAEVHAARAESAAIQEAELKARQVQRLQPGEGRGGVQ